MYWQHLCMVYKRFFTTCTNTGFVSDLFSLEAYSLFLQCVLDMGRQPCCEKIGLKRGPWTTEEDHKLTNFILHNGIHCWRAVPKLAGLLRCGKSCRLRWINYLRPDLKRGALSEWEENQIIQLHKRLGNKWSKIAAHFPGRTDNEIKNHWNTGIKKRLKDLGLDPVTHLPINQSCETEERMIETAQNPNASGQQYDSSKAESIDNHAMQQQEFPLSTEGSKEKKQISDVDQLLLFEGSSDLLDNCDEKLGGIDLTVWLNQPSPSPSFSAGDFLNPSVGESSSNSIMEDPFQQWVDNVDSLLSWDGFNLLQDELFFLDQIKTQKQ